jgi:hypothetical protein
MCERAAPCGYTNDNVMRRHLSIRHEYGLARDIEELYVTGDKEEKRGVVIIT